MSFVSRSLHAPLKVDLYDLSGRLAGLGGRWFDASVSQKSIMLMFYAKSGCISHGKRCIENVLSRKEKSGAWTIGGTSGGKRASEEKPSTVVKVVDEQTDEEILHKAKIDSVLKALTRYFRKMDEEVFLRGGQLEWSCKPHVELSFPSPPSQCKKKKDRRSPPS